MSTPVTAAPPATASPAVLKIDDPSGLETCDKCGGAALWRVVFTAGELLFCGHHAVAFGYVSRATSHVAYENENKSKGSDH